MIRRLFRMGLLLGVLGALALLVSRWLAPRPRPIADRPAPSPPSAPTLAWVEPTAGACPASHPVKAKLSSRIFHVPGGASYERTTPDRCYLNAAAAEADGLRAAKR